MKSGETSRQDRQDKQGSMAERFAALSRVGMALMSEFDEKRLLHMIAETACELTGASFAAFTLRPINEEGQPIVPSEGYLFRLAAVVGVSEAQEKSLQHMSLGGEGLLAPIFRQGVPVRIADVLTLMHNQENAHSLEGQDAAREAAIAYAHGHIPAEGLHYMGVPRGHPIMRSFLGAPLLDREREVRGGLLLGHVEADKFTQDDESLLVGLAAQAAVALENARLYNSVQMRAQELNAIFESIVDGVTLVDSQGRILRENGTARRLREALQAQSDGSQTIEALLHEPARQALQGETVQDSTVTMPDERNEEREYLVNASPLNAPTSTGPLIEKTHGHGSLPVPPRGSRTSRPLPVPTNNGERMVAGAVVVWHDVTEARRLIIERRNHAEAEALKDEFIGIAAHELRNPLAVLKGFAQMLIVQTARGKGPQLTDWQMEAIEGIDQSTSRMVELIDDLLDVTRLQAGRLELYLEPTNLIDLTRRVITKLQITTERHTVALHTTLEHLVVNLDARRMEQVLNNILGNAIKYSPDGGSIDITISEDGKQQMALLSIQDRGIGIPLSQQARVFGRFVRAENAQLLGIGGTGLGLYLSRELVERHGGRIWFESAEGEGSTFFIALQIEDFSSNPQ